MGPVGFLAKGLWSTKATMVVCATRNAWRMQPRLVMRWSAMIFRYVLRLDDRYLTQSNILISLAFAPFSKSLLGSMHELIAVKSKARILKNVATFRSAALSPFVWLLFVVADLFLFVCLFVCLLFVCCLLVVGCLLLFVCCLLLFVGWLVGWLVRWFVGSLVVFCFLFLVSCFLFLVCLLFCFLGFVFFHGAVH